MEQKKLMRASQLMKKTKSLRGGLAAVAAALVLGLLLASQTTEAHKPIRSKYTFNEDVFPIFRDRCGQCHVEDGPAPMSLMTHRDAFPWAESIKEEVVRGHMPPWLTEDGYGKMKNPHALTTKELDIIMTWSTGGNPEGPRAKRPAPVELKNEWKLGAPDLVLQMPAEHTISESVMQDQTEVVLPTGLTADRWLKAIDLLPGTPSIVRKATIVVKEAAAKGAPAAKGSTAPAPERVLATWTPGYEPVPMMDDAAFKLAAKSELTLRINYRKTWKYEGQKMVDRSSVGLYFRDKPAAAEIGALDLTSQKLEPAAMLPSEKVTISRVIDRDLDVLALWPETTPNNSELTVDLLLPNGSKQPLVHLGESRPNWQRRYWFPERISLPKGSKVEVTASFNHRPLDVKPASPAAAATVEEDPAQIRLWLNVVPSQPKRTASR